MGKTKTAIIDDSNTNVGAGLSRPVDGSDDPTPTATPEQKEIKKVKTSKRASKKIQNAPKKRGKKYQEALEKVDKEKKYPLKEAVELAQQVSFSKFPGTIEAHINTNVKNIRGLINLPYFAGKVLRILAFGPSSAFKEAIEGVVAGTEEHIEEITKGKINFDVIVATPDWMPKLAKVAKILGPRGLMPNPKNDTVTQNLSKTITDLKGGKVEYKTEKEAAVVHLPIGKVAQPAEEITANLKALYNTIGRSKVLKITLAPTMGPGIKVDTSSL